MMVVARVTTARWLLVFGLLAFCVAGLSIVDMYRPRPYDGVVLEADAPGQLVVRKVVVGSGAHQAGLRPGDQIIGIDRSILKSKTHAAGLLNQRQIGDEVPYFVRRGSGLEETLVTLGPHRIGSLPYLYACLLGFAFFFVGLFVLTRQPGLRAAQIFFLLSILFLVFLVCRLRPASYTWIDSFVLTTGMVALLFLPATFLHFFLIFPKPVPLRPAPADEGYAGKRRRWLAILWAVYLLPPLVLAATVAGAWIGDRSMLLISGAPAANWWMLAIYMLVGLTALAVSARRVRNPRARRGVALVLLGVTFGLVPFLVVAVAFPSFLHTEKFLFVGVAPLILVPLTFAYAIVRFELLNIRVIVRKSLLYTATTAVVTAFYAAGIALFNGLTRGSRLAESAYFPIVFALVIVLLFEPLRRSIQVLVDRFYYAERGRLERAIRDLGRAFALQVDLTEVVRDLVDKLPQVAGVRFAALYLLRGDRLERAAGPAQLPRDLPYLPELHESLAARNRLVQLGEISPVAAEPDQIAELTDALEAAGVEAIGDLASQRRRVGLLLLSGKKEGQLGLDPAELELLDDLLQQVAVGIETSMLLEERTQQVELERDLEIAARVQSELLPSSVGFGPGWRAAAICLPARQVGGDFFTELPGPTDGTGAIVYGDVAGKSVSGAMVMMAAHEVMHSLALTHRDPETLMGLANQRLLQLGPGKSFVAMAYLASAPAGDGLYYILAGQPQPLLRSLDGRVRELPLPAHRLPLGALDNGSYRLSRADLAVGELVLGYSDGVIDAQAPGGEPFGVDRLAQVVAAANGDPPSVVAEVITALKDFTEGSEPYDDITLVAVCRNPEVERCADS
jgi:serine phosphatase RsbU (regulator of sigma subunit)